MNTERSNGSLSQSNSNASLARPTRSCSQPQAGPRSNSSRELNAQDAERCLPSTVQEGDNQGKPQVVPKAPQPKAPSPKSQRRFSKLSSRSSTSPGSHPQTITAPLEAPVHLQVQQILQNVAQRGNYSLLSVTSSMNMDGFIRFRDAPGWLQGNMGQWQESRALIVVLEVEKIADRRNLRKLVRVLRASPQRKRVFAVPLLIDNTNLMQDNQQAVSEVLDTGVDDFFTQIDAGLFSTIEIALLRTANVARELNNLGEEIANHRNQIEYMHWQWIPSQFQLTAFPNIDTHLEEQPDGSLDELQFVRSLGRGVFGTVHEALTPSGQTLAVKVMRKDNAPTIFEAERIYREVQILSSLPHHQNLAHLHFVLHSLDTIYICLAYGGPHNLYHLQLRQPNRAFALDTAQELFGQLADAVGHMHRHVFFHRDIKPENIAVNGTQERGYQIMLVDCGLAVNTDKPLKQSCGSLPFAAPEVLNVPCRYYGGPVDAFALGMLLFELIRGQSTMENMLGWTRGTQPSALRAHELRVLLANGPPDANRHTNEPIEVQRLLSGLLQIDPAVRINLLHVMRSPWLSNPATEQGTPATQQ